MKKYFSRLKGRKAVTIAALSVFVMGVLVTLISTITYRSEVNLQIEDTLKDTSSNIRNIITRRAGTYELILVSASSLFEIKENSSSDDWRRHIHRLDIDKSFPATSAIGFAEVIDKDEIRTHESSVRSQGFPNYNVHPETNRSSLAPVTYIEPLNAANKIILGYDMFSEGNQRQAMAKARDQNIVSASSPIDLAAEAGDEKQQPGVHLYKAVYGIDKPDKLFERKTFINGFSFASIRTQDFMNALFNEDFTNENVGFKISDRSNGKSTTLFTSAHYKQVTKQRYNVEISSVAFFDKNWQVEVKAVSSKENIAPIIIFIAGMAFSLLSSGTIYLLLHRRLKQLADEHTKEVEKSKNELIALASHQLRTPASGVKQYIGMLIQGYAGNLSEEQTDLLKKAYSGNEKQLEIINQLLYVAKAETNQLFLEPESTDLTKLIRNVVEELSHQASSKKIKLNFKQKRKVYAEVDPRYTSMAVSNVVNNAIKYSHKNSKVDIKVSLSNGVAAISIKDRGVGIDQKDYNKLFEKFSRISNKYSKIEGGTGLGLFLAMRITEAHHGTIKVSSSKKNTLFTLVFPKKFVKKPKRNPSNRIRYKKSVNLSDGEKK